MSRTTTDIETEVERHASFVRGVALRLTLDPSAAEDVVQQTALAALEHRPEVGAGLRRWLGRVAANFALRMLRADGRRREREHAAARPDAVEGDAADRHEIVERLTKALATLDEPFRTAVILRYYDGLEPCAIAVRLGIPPGTARTRIKRGLDRLRDDLDRAYGGDRRRWSLLALPLVFSKPAGGVAAAVSAASSASAVPVQLVKGAVLMSKKMMIAVGIVVIGTCAYIATELDAWDAPAELAGGEGEVVADPAEPGARRPATMAEAAAVPGAEIEVESTGSEKRATAPVARPRARLEGRCVDEAGDAVVGADVMLRLHPLAMSEGTLVRDRLVRRATSGRDGRFEFDELPTAHEAALRARTAALADARTRRSLDAPKSIDVGDLVLAAGGAITGRVVRGGRPVSGASIDAWRREAAAGGGNMLLISSLGPDPRSVDTDASGRFELRGLGDGEWMVRVTADGARPALKHGLHVANAGVVEGVEIELVAGLELRGLVRDVTGAALNGAVVTLSNASITVGTGASGGIDSSVATTDVEGRFRFGRLSPDPFNLSIVCPGYAFANKFMVMPSDDEYTIELEPTGIAWGRVRDADSGAALDDCRVSADRGLHGAAVAEILLGEAAAAYLDESDPTGLFVVTGATSREVLLTVAAPDRPRSTVRTPSLDAGTRHEMAVALQRARAIDGVVRDSDGKPLAGARVVARRGDPSPAFEGVESPGPGVRRWMRRIGDAPEPAGVVTPLRSRETFTDADGTFRIDEIAAAIWSVTAHDDDHAPTRARVDLTEEAAATLDLRLEAGGVLAGRVWRKPGVPFDGVRVVLEPVELDDDSASEDRRTVLADAAGAFEICGLQPGEYEARIDEADMMRPVMMMAPGEERPAGVAATVEAARTTRIDITAPPKGTVAGVVVENGRPVAGVRARLVGTGDMSPFNAETVHTDEWGMFRFERVDPGEWTLTIRHPLGPEDIERPVEVIAHRVVEETFELPTGVLRGRVADRTGKGIEGVVVRAGAVRDGNAAPRRRAMSIAMTRGGGGPSMVQTMTAGPPEVRTDSTGRFELRHVPAGNWRVSVSGQGIIAASRDDIEMKENATRSGIDFVAEKGATLEVRLVGSLPEPGLGLVNVTEDREGAEPQLRPSTGEPVTFDGLRPGRYVLSIGGVGPAAGNLATKTITVRPGKAVVEIDI